MSDEKPTTEIGADLLGIGKVGAQALKTAEPFLMKLFGPYLEERGQMLADGVREKRRQNLLSAAVLAAEQVGDREVQAVPGRILFPLLDGASNEELPELQKMWATLMATASVEPDAIMPAFPKILSELSALEARCLAFVQEDMEKQHATMAPKHYTPISVEDLSMRFGVDPNYVVLGFANFIRLGLVTADIQPPTTDLHIRQIRMMMTPFGTAFIRACTRAL